MEIKEIEAFFCSKISESDRNRDKDLTQPENVDAFRYLQYGEDELWHRLDVYLPKNASGKMTTILNFHGGGYAGGSTEQYKYYCMNLASRGFAVVSFIYHLAPEYKFPTPLIEAGQVLQWMIDHSEEYHFDMDDLFVVGDSVGSQLTSHMALIWENPAYADIIGIHYPEVKIRGIGLNCGFYDLEHDPECQSKLKHYFGENPTEVHGEKIKVWNYIDGNYPPTYVLSAGGDFLRERAVPMYNKLRSEGIPAAIGVYGDVNLKHVFHVDMGKAIAHRANSDELQFLMQFRK